jgi:tRNA (guanine37-N1)-methyltransferase
VDDYPCGGGAGMVMKPGRSSKRSSRRASGKVLLMSARGRRFTHADAVRWSLARELTLLCGHYKDVDQRVADHLATDEVSLGDFVLTGGEPAALCVLDAVVRLLPGALGDHESASGDSHYDGLLSPPAYPPPRSEVLLSAATPPSAVAAGGGAGDEIGARIYGRSMMRVVSRRSAVDRRELTTDD